MQTVFMSPDQAMAESVVLFLRAAGYHPANTPPRRAQGLPAGRILYRVNVPSDEMRGAREVLAQIDPNSP